MRREQTERSRKTGSVEPDRAALLQAARDLAARHPEIEAIYLFGSRACGTARSGSDVDIAVLLSAPEPPGRGRGKAIDFAHFLEDRLGSVDVVVLSPDLPPALLFEIFRFETILFARDDERARRVAARARAEYRDLLPRLGRRLSRTLRRIQEHADALDRA